MRASEEYVIQFAGLSVGEHLFELSVNDKFFESLDYSEIKQGNIQVKVNLEIQSSMMVFRFDIDGTVKVDCDRCAEGFDLPIKGKNKLIVKVGGNFDRNEDDDIIGVAGNEHKIDLTQFLYEYIILSVPIKRVHSDESYCDEEQMKKLKKVLSEETNKQEIGKTGDPRWDGLKDIKLN